MDPTTPLGLIASLDRLLDLARRAPVRERPQYLATASWLLARADKSGASARDLLRVRSEIHALDSLAKEAA